MFNDEEQQNILEVFEKLNKEDIQYIVPRKYEELPKKSLGEDIDIIVNKKDFNESISVLNQIGFEDYERKLNYSLILKGLRNPLKAIKVVFTNPQASKNLLGAYEKNIETKKLVKGDIILDLKNKLAYKSTSIDHRIPADPQLEKFLFDNSRRHKEVIKVPSIEDELTHIVAHCIFDKDGNFEEYYQERVKYLLKDADRDKVRSRLEKIFFKAEKFVYKKMRQDELSKLRKNLVQYSDY